MDESDRAVVIALGKEGYGIRKITKRPGIHRVLFVVGIIGLQQTLIQALDAHQNSPTVL